VATRREGRRPNVKVKCPAAEQKFALRKYQQKWLRKLAEDAGISYLG